MFHRKKNERLFLNLLLQTDYSNQGSANYYYTIELKSFSYFAIGRETPVQSNTPVTNLQGTQNTYLPNTNPSFENAANLRAPSSGGSNEIPEANLSQQFPDKEFIYILVIALLAAGIIFTIVKLIWKKHENPHHSAHLPVNSPVF